MQTAPNSKSALGLDANVTALLGYLIWIVALVLVFIEKDNKFVRFHAVQSLLWSLAVTIVSFAMLLVFGVFAGLFVAMGSNALGSLLWGLMVLMILGLSLAAMAGLILAMVKAYGGEMWKLPIVGNLAEKWS